MNKGSLSYFLKGLIVRYCVLLCLGLTSGGCDLFNQKPIMESLMGAPESVDPLGISQLRCIPRDRDRDKLSYTWSATAGTILGEGSTVNWKAPGTPGSYTITVVVSDGKGGKATGQIVIDVLSEQNTPPFIKSITADPWKVDRGKTSKITMSAVDIDGDQLAYTWSATAGNISGEGPVVTWTAPKKDGQYIITGYATDSKGSRSGKKFVTVTVYCECND